MRSSACGYRAISTLKIISLTNPLKCSFMSKLIHSSSRKATTIQFHHTRYLYSYFNKSVLAVQDLDPIRLMIPIFRTIPSLLKFYKKNIKSITMLQLSPCTDSPITNRLSLCEITRALQIQVIQFIRLLHNS